METIEQGQAIFEGKGLCTTCHGPKAEGAVGPDLTDSDWLQAKGSYLSVLQVVLAGVPETRSATGTGMPARGDTHIGDADVQSVAAYVWKNSHPAAGDSLPTGVTDAMVRRGEQVFLGEGGCALCHGSDATGLVGPDLTDDVWLDAKGSFSMIGQIITYGVSEAASTRGVEMPPKGGSDLSDAEIQQVTGYVWYLSHR
jgi:cytochrome c oxidase cbb3-type subunit 3